MDSDTLPLLQFEEQEIEKGNDSAEREESNSNENERHSKRDSSLIDITETRRSRRHHFFGKDLIVATFVVAFDTKKGIVAPSTGHHRHSIHR